MYLSRTINQFSESLNRYLAIKALLTLVFSKEYHFFERDLADLVPPILVNTDSEGKDRTVKGKTELSLLYNCL